MTARRTARLLAAAIAVGALLWAPAGALADDAPAPMTDQGTSWSIAPATAEGPDGRLSLRHVLDPGGSATDWVDVHNFGPQDATFRVYAAAGAVGESGTFDIDPEAGDGGVLVSLAETDGTAPDADGTLTLHLPAEESATVPLTITATDTARPGDHPVGVVAELVPQGDTDVRLRTRVGVRAHLRVSGELTARVVAEDVRTTWAPGWNPLARGTLHVEYVLHNTGNVRLGATSTVDAAGPFGAVRATSTDSIREILPGERHAVRAEVPLWGLLRTQGEVRVDVGAVGEDVLEAELRPAATSFTAWTVPWAQLLVVVLVLLAVPVARHRRRLRERRVQHEIDSALTAAGLAPAPTDSEMSRA